MYKMDGYSTTEENKVIRELEEEMQWESMFTIKRNDLTIKIFEERRRCSKDKKEYKFYDGMIRQLIKHPLYNRVMEGSRRQKLD